MREITIDEVLKHADCLVHQAVPVKLYYIYYGRNSWNSTWIQRFTAGCIHPSFSSACSYAERKRTQGTVFYIRELPAVWFQNDRIPFYITEINELHPLKEFMADLHRLRERIEDVADYFSPRKPNSTLRLAPLREERPEKFYGSPAPLTQYQSFSIGGDAPLGWKPMRTKILTDATFVLTEAFNKRFGKQELPVRVGHPRSEVSKILGTPVQISRHALKDLPESERQHFTNLALADNTQLERWLFRLGTGGLAVFVMPKQGLLGQVDPGVLALCPCG